MCTLSVCLDFEKNSALVTMNRDESRSRDSENEPDYYWNDDIFGPQDSVGGGTWFAVNNRGHYAALLNAYGEANYSPTSPQSRGEIIPVILPKKNPIEHIQKMDLSPYPGFKLVIGHQTEKPVLFSWDGSKLQQKKFHATYKDRLFFHTSSSVDQSKVIDLRVDRFNHWAQSTQSLSRDLIPSFHHDTLPDSSSAILMSRPKSVTKSITSAEINNEIKMRYLAIKSSKVSLIKSYSFHGRK